MIGVAAILALAAPCAKPRRRRPRQRQLADDPRSDFSARGVSVVCRRNNCLARIALVSHRIRRGTAAPQALALSATSISSSLGSETAAFQYSGPTGLLMTVSYTLEGGSDGSGTSVFDMNVNVSNTGLSSLPLVQLFQCANFTLTSSDSLLFPYAPYDGDITQSASNGSLNSVITGTKLPSAYEAGPQASVLADVSTATTSDGAKAAAPGDVASGLQWDISLAPGKSFLISEATSLQLTSVPEPSTLVLLAVGAGGALCAAWAAALVGKAVPPQGRCAGLLASGHRRRLASVSASAGSHYIGVDCGSKRGLC